MFSCCHNKLCLLCINKNNQVTDHDGNVMSIRQRQGAVHVQDVMLCAQEALQVLRVRGHLLGNSIHAPPADQSLHEQQRHSLLLTVHHHLQEPRSRGGEGWLQTGKAKNTELNMFLHCNYVYHDGSRRS